MQFGLFDTPTADRVWGLPRIWTDRTKPPPLGFYCLHDRLITGQVGECPGCLTETGDGLAVRKSERSR